MILRLCCLMMNVSRILRKGNFILAPRIHTSAVKSVFWERDPKGGYGTNADFWKWKNVTEGFQELKKECKLFFKEAREHFEADPILIYPPGVIDKVWSLDSQEEIDNWTCASDSDHAEGYSTCNFTLNANGRALFSGNLCTDVPKKGTIKRAGYCSIRSKRIRRSFKREAFYDWTPYTHLVMRVRGDGRSYMINIATSGYFDQLWNDVYHYILFTRGGPYWQTVKIPFSKFFFANKGRLQDRQCEVALDKVTHFGLTASDGINGPFSLEIDFIGLENVPYHEEKFAYEMYKTEKNIAGH